MMGTVKQKTMGIDRELAIGLGMLVFLLLLVGGYGIYRSNSLAELTDKLYLHPLAVSNSVRDIRSDILAMHRGMKDVTLARNEAQMMDALRKVDSYEQDALRNFALVLERYLGDKSEVEDFRRKFIDWKNIRSEVIEYMRRGEQKQASAITMGKGARYVAMLDQRVESLITFASAKGRAFHAMANQEHANAIIAMSILLSVAVLVAFTVAYYMHRATAERGRTQGALQFTQFAVDHATDAVFWMGPDARFIYVNKAACQRLGYTQSELFALAAYEIGPDWSAEAWPEHWRELKTAGSLTFETRHQRKDGSIFPVEITANFLTFDGREFNCAIVRDITERQRAMELAEAELSRLRDGLVRVTRLAAIGQVSASIAHDIRNPMGVIRNAVFYLKRKATLEPPLLREYLQIIDHEVSTAEGIIRNLLSLARQEAPKKRNVDLGQLVSEVFAGLKQAATVECAMFMVPEDFIVWVDPDQLAQVFRNLLENACDAMAGNGKITVDARHGEEVDIIMVRDTGPGVAPEILPVLFEPLVTTKAKGTGLGLFICAQVIERHSGKIELVEPETNGTTFCIQLPRQQGIRSNLQGEDNVHT